MSTSSLASSMARFNARYTPEPNTGCWLWLGSLTGGYGRIQVYLPEKILEMAHRASWVLHRGRIADGLIVCHRCDVRSCVNPDHLFLGTYTDNMRDAAQKGRMKWKSKERPRLPRGEKHHSAKLTASNVIAIRNSPMSGVDAARTFGVTPKTISRIRRREIWRHVGAVS